MKSLDLKQVQQQICGEQTRIAASANFGNQMQMHSFFNQEKLTCNVSNKTNLKNSPNISNTTSLRA